MEIPRKKRFANVVEPAADTPPVTPDEYGAAITADTPDGGPAFVDTVSAGGSAFVNPVSFGGATLVENARTAAAKLRSLLG